MKTVLESDQARLARGEVLDPPTEIEEEQPSEDLPEEPEEAEEDQEETPDEGEQAEGEEEVADDDTDDDEGEAEEEPEALHEEDEDFYLEVGGARYRTREEAERGVEETRRAFLDRSQKLAEAEREREELRQQVAYYQGRDSTRGQEGDFEAWADARIGANPEQGMIEAIQASRDTNDQSYAYAYTDRWAESDPYQASIWRNRLETAIFQTQAQPQAEEQQEEGASDVQQVINDTWESLVNEYPDLQDDQMVQGIADTIRTDPELRQAALTGEPVTVRLAFTAARKVVRSQRNAPKRVRTSDAERVAREKRAATVSSGDGAPTRRSSSPDLTAEEENILAGADRLGLKRRDQ